MKGIDFRAAQAAVIGNSLECYNCGKMYDLNEMVTLEVCGASNNGYSSEAKLHCTSCIPSNRAWNQSWVPGVRPLDQVKLEALGRAPVL